MCDGDAKNEKIKERLKISKLSGNEKTSKKTVQVLREGNRGDQIAESRPAAGIPRERWM